MSNTPSIKKISEAFPECSKEIKNLITGKTKTRDYESVNVLIKSCYHAPSYQHRLVTALNQITKQFGYEYVEHNNDDSLSFEYINTGDVYNSTIIVFNSGKVIISDVASIVERGNYK